MHVKGHAGDPYNELADQFAKMVSIADRCKRYDISNLVKSNFSAPSKPWALHGSAQAYDVGILLQLFGQHIINNRCRKCCVGTDQRVSRVCKYHNASLRAGVEKVCNPIIMHPQFSFEVSLNE